jgi:hypothetical protein
MNEKSNRTTPKESGNPEILKMLVLSICQWACERLTRNSLVSRKARARRGRRYNYDVRMSIDNPGSQLRACPLLVVS